MAVFTRSSRRKATLAALAERVLEVPDLLGLTRLLTVDLCGALAADAGSLLLWDRRLESFEALALDEAGRLRRGRPDASEGPRARFLLSRCVPVKLKSPPLNAKDGGVAIEELQLAYETLTMTKP